MLYNYFLSETGKMRALEKLYLLVGFSSHVHIINFINNLSQL